MVSLTVKYSFLFLTPSLNWGGKFTHKCMFLREPNKKINCFLPLLLVTSLNILQLGWYVSLAIYCISQTSAVMMLTKNPFSKKFKPPFLSSNICIFSFSNWSFNTFTSKFVFWMDISSVFCSPNLLWNVLWSSIYALNVGHVCPFMGIKL